MLETRILLKNNRNSAKYYSYSCNVLFNTKYDAPYHLKNTRCLKYSELVGKHIQDLSLRCIYYV